MKRNILNHGCHDEKRTTSRKDDCSSLPHSRSEEERRRRRREWLIQQEREREHERLKKKMIIEYELKRAREQGARHISGRSPDHSCSKSKSRSQSLEDQPRRDTKATTSKSSVMSGKLETTCGTTPLFKGPEGTQISASELRRIKVDIHRNIPVQGKVNELQRDILNPEDVTIIRRRGEGSIPIFEREEIKGTLKKVNEIEEHRTVIALDNEDSVKKKETLKRHSPSFHSSRNHSRSPRPSTSRRSRSRDSPNANFKFDRHSSRKIDRRRSRGKSGESERKYKEHESSRDRESLPREYKDHRRDNRSSRLDHRESRRRGNESKSEDESRTTNRSTESRARGRERERERERERSRSDSRSRFRYRERQVIPSHCIEQVPYPIYYGPRPIMVGPVMPIRGQIPIARSRLPPSLMGPMRPFPPRFIHSDMYRLGPPPPPNYRFGSMF